ncbi:MAG: prepilin-type N-terminal cleavage/methylation domain-containing protein [Bacilli bacterium]|nr:prepilin-type N-terminal cleavage/methylation domain-containing protein [Bacilli bacterium]
MKRSKAFTLIELLAVIVILGILIGITTVSVNGIRKKQEAENRRNAYSSVLTGAKTYIAENPEALDNLTSTLDINVKDLVDSGYVELDMNKYDDLIYRYVSDDTTGGIKRDANGNKVISSNNQYRTLTIGKCPGMEHKLYYAFYDVNYLRKDLNWTKNKNTIYYNDCGCEEQIGGGESAKLCIGSNGKNSESEDVIY